ncbi:MAG TPA: NAD(P)/FAD-dependent oxidoreductase [Polyangiaceae bacterium]|jgi:phytoene dehydrogenase-like protein
MTDSYDAVVIGAGPNGLAAAAAFVRAGVSVLVVEANDTLGGGARSAEVTAPGFVSDVCSAIHPTAVVSPFLRTLPLAEHGLAWVHPPVCVAHPLDDGTAAVLERSIEATGASFDDARDARAYARLFAPLAARSDSLFAELLGPPRIPRSPLLMLRFGLRAMRSASGLARGAFAGERARALFAGCAAHSFQPLGRAFTAAFGLVLGVAGHAIGWPCARGGSQSIANALVSYITSRGGDFETGRRVARLRDLPPAKAYVFDVTPRSLAAIAREQLPPRYVRGLERYRHGPGIFKIDYALDGPIPWTAPRAGAAGTVHVGGTLGEVEASEAAMGRGEHAERPFVLVAQQSLFDTTRAPPGKHTGWAYCHVPSGSTVDMTSRIEAQIERFAPGFRDRVIARRAMTSADLEVYDANYVGGDIVGGATDVGQLFMRPMLRIVPYATPNDAIYLCSSSTPPGAGVHGMCGYFAAKAALRRVFGVAA